MSKTSAFPKILHVGDKQILDLFEGEVEITEKLDGCVAPDTKILMSDFSYKKAGDLTVGDEVVGFDEDLNNARFKRSYITALKPDIDRVYDILLEDGRTVTVTFNHPLVVRRPKKTPNGLSKEYVEAQHIKPGDRIVDIGLWNHEQTYESGYIAGQYDGEGSLVGKSKGIYGHLSYYQNEGKGALLIKSILEDRGFTVGYSSRQRREDWGVCETLRINGGLSERMRFLGTFRPQRLLDGAFEKIFENTPFNSIKDIGVVQCDERPIKSDIIRISTSTKTYVADGLCSHNSQFGFGRVDGELVTRSKGRVITDPDKLFIPAVNHVRSIEHLLPEDLFFYGETLCQPRHSTLAYDRIPTNNIALFGVLNRHTREFLDYENIKWWADKLEVDAVPLLFKGTMSQSEVLKFVDDTISYLGGQNIEGVVVKAYKPWMFLGQIPLSVMSGKYVTEAFKEVHQKDWSKLNTGKGKFDVLKENYRTEARWNKAVQHLRERGELVGSPKDIGALLKEVYTDIEEEEQENIKDQLYSIYKNDIMKYATHGLAQWWKEKLVKGEVNEDI